MIELDGSETIVEKELQQSHIVWAVNGPKRKSSDAPAMTVLANVLSGGMSFRLFKNIRDDLGLCYSIFAGRHSTTDQGTLYGYIGTDPEKSDQAKKAIKEELIHIQSKLLSDDEFEKAINYTKGSFMLKMESSDSINEYHGYAALYDLDTDFDAYLNRIDRVTKEQVLEVAKKYIDIEKMVFIEVTQKSA